MFTPSRARRPFTTAAVAGAVLALGLTACAPAAEPDDEPSASASASASATQAASSTPSPSATPSTTPAASAEPSQTNAPAADDWRVQDPQDTPPADLSLAANPVFETRPRLVTGLAGVEGWVASPEKEGHRLFTQTETGCTSEMSEMRLTEERLTAPDDHAATVELLAVNLGVDTSEFDIENLTPQVVGKKTEFGSDFEGLSANVELENGDPMYVFARAFIGGEIGFVADVTCSDPDMLAQAMSASWTVLGLALPLGEAPE